LVNIKNLNQTTKLPVIAVTDAKPDLNAVHKALYNLPEIEERWKIVLEAGEIHEVLSKARKLYVEIAGISLGDAIEIIKLTSTRSSLPEPLRVAHLIASGITSPIKPKMEKV
jgi:endonuclease V-like protein UPF0215 family